jgi:lysozyme
MFLNKLKINLKQGQYDALIDFMFNLGISKFTNSTLYKLIKAGSSDEEICNEFMKWVHVGKKTLPGLVKRRKWECEQWNKNK